MTEAGKKVIALAKKNGSWSRSDEVEKLIIPDDLQNAFSKSKIAAKNFSGFPPSSQKIILGWIKIAKKPETREKRINETVRLAAKNMRANHPVTGRSKS